MKIKRLVKMKNYKSNKLITSLCSTLRRFYVLLFFVKQLRGVYVPVRFL